MTLATRCSACGTSFRVVQDQLKVSGGWVRCGRCNEVFNALDALFEIDTQQQVAVRPGGGTAPRSAEPASAFAPPPAPAAPAAPSSGSADTARPAATDTGLVTGGAMAEPELPHASPLPPSEPAAWDDRPVRGFEDVETRLEPRPGDDIGPTPSFMHARHAAHERGPARRGRWAVLCAVLSLLLVVQLGLAWRDALAAQAPDLKPALVEACRWLNCRVEPPRLMAALSVDGSNLRQRAGVDGYELMVALRNRSGSAVMLPAFELTLTDSQGQALIRRVVQASELGAIDPQFGPGGELALHALLDVSDRRVAGYTIEIFYP